VLDPDAGFRVALAAALWGAGYEVEEGENGRTISTAVGPVDVLITWPRPRPAVEMLMPQRDGLEALRAARARWPAVRVIATTAGRGALSADYPLGVAAHLGADVTLAKETPLATFLATVDSLVKPGA